MMSVVLPKDVSHKAKVAFDLWKNAAVINNQSFMESTSLVFAVLSVGCPDKLLDDLVLRLQSIIDEHTFTANDSKH